MEQDNISHNEIENELAEFIQNNLTREQLDIIGAKVAEILAVVRDAPGGQEIIEKTLSGVGEWLSFPHSQ
jgi:hypothetical protein